MSLTLGDITKTLPANNFQGGLVFFEDRDEDRVLLQNENLAREQVREFFELDTEFVVDGIFPGTGSLNTSTLADDIAILNMEFLSSWISPTGTWKLLDADEAIDNLEFTWETFSLVPPGQPDSDSDGIDDIIDGRMISGIFQDEHNLVSDNFTDQNEGGTTFGTITNRADLTILVTDDAAGGVNVAASGEGTGTANIGACGEPVAYFDITEGDVFIILCGSVTASVVAGPVNFQIGVNTVVTVPTEGSVSVIETAPDTFAIENLSESDGAPISVNDGSGEQEIAPGEVLNVMTVTIDIRPGSSTNCFNQNGHGVIPVAILGSSVLDVTGVNLSTLSFSGLTVRVRGRQLPQYVYELLNSDSFWDLVCKFEDDSSMWTLGGSEAGLTGELFDGTSISGSDNTCMHGFEIDTLIRGIVCNNFTRRSQTLMCSSQYF